MGYDYFFQCEKCKESINSVSRKAWGWEMLRPEEIKDFLKKHIMECGSAHIQVKGENQI